MVLKNYAQTEYDIINHELKVFSRHSFDTKGLKIVGAVSVIFVQNIEQDDHVEEWQKQKTVSSSLSVITVPDFSICSTAGKCNQNESPEEPCNSEHDNFTSSCKRSNLEISKEDEFNSKNISIIDFSKTIEAPPQDNSHFRRHTNEGQGQIHSHIKQVQGHALRHSNHSYIAALKNPTSMTSFIPLADISKVRNSTPKSCKTNVLKEIPKTIALVTEEPNYEQFSKRGKDLKSHLPKTIEALQEKKGPVAKTRPKFMRIRSLVVTKEKNSDVRCGLCHVKLESCREIISHSKEHNLDLKCCVCDATFASYCNMRRHCAGHVQTILHVCSLCHCAYKRKDNLQTHIRKHYLNAGMPFRQPVKHSFAKSMSQQTKTYTPTEGRRNIDNSMKAGNSINVNTQIYTTISERPTNPGLKNSMHSSKYNLPATESLHIDLTSDDEQNKDEERMDVVESLNKHLNTEDTNLSSQTHAYNMSNNSTLGHSITEMQHSPSEQENAKTVADSNNVYPGQIIQKKILNYSCSSCNINFENIQNLKRHILSQHSEDVDSQSQQSNHNLIVESDTAKTNQISIENFQSTESDKQIIDIGNLIEYSNMPNQYLSINQNDGVSLEDSTSNIHLLPANQNNSMSTAALKSHEETSNGSSPQILIGKPKNRYAERLDSVTPICRICGLMLKNVQQVIDHRLNHTSEIPQLFGCTICPADLSSKECLKRHVRNHLGEEYQCHYCQSKYNRKDNLYTHMKNAHGWVKPPKNNMFPSYYMDPQTK